MEHYQKVMIALLESVMINRQKRPLADKSRWRHIRLAMKPRYLGNHASQNTDKTLIWNTIRKSWSLFQIPSWKIAWSAPLAEKSRWRHIRLAIKPRYLGKHASHIKSYYGTLSESHDRSFRIRHEKSPKAPPSGWITMKSYPTCNKTSLSQKPCITYKKLLWNTIRKSWSLFQIPLWKYAGSAPWRWNHDDVISGLQQNLVISETMLHR